MASRKEQKEQARAQRAAREADSAAAARRQRRIRLIGAVIGGGLLVLVIAIAIQSGSNGGDASIKGASEVDASLSGIPQSGLVLGKRNAPVKIIEFGDLQCPACKQFNDSELDTVISDLIKPGKAKLEFQNFTIIGPESTTAAKGSLAASVQDRYWQFIELFYRNQGIENSGYVTDDFLESVAKAAGVADLDKWNADLDKPAWDADLDAVQKEASRLGFDSTPSFQIEGANGQTAVPDEPTASSIAKAVEIVQ